MEALLNVSDCFCKEILTTWLTLVDIAKLDSAFCSHKCRPVFLQEMASEPAVYGGYPMDARNSDKIELFTQWIAAREIFVKELFTDSSLVLTSKYYEYGGQELRKLYLTHHYEPGLVDLEQALDIIARNCAKLKELGILSLNGFDSGHFVALSRLHHLQHLNINDTIILDPDALQQALTKWSDLRTLEAALCDLLDADLVQLAECCPKLQRLHVTRCDGLTDTAICAVATHCHHLTELDIQGTNVTDVTVREIALNCAHLQVLLAGECMEISDDSILLLSQRCSQLHTLDVRRSYTSDVSLHSLAAHNAQLRYLDISECADISEEGIITLATRCTLLESLHLSADQVTLQTLQLLGDRAVVSNHHLPGHGMDAMITGDLGSDDDGDSNSDVEINGDY